MKTQQTCPQDVTVLKSETKTLSSELKATAGTPKYSRRMCTDICHSPRNTVPLPGGTTARVQGHGRGTKKARQDVSGGIRGCSPQYSFNVGDDAEVFLGESLGGNPKLWAARGPPPGCPLSGPIGPSPTAHSLGPPFTGISQEEKAREASAPVRGPPALLTAEPRTQGPCRSDDHLSLLDTLELFLDFMDKQLCVFREVTIQVTMSPMWQHSHRGHTWLCWTGSSQLGPPGTGCGREEPPARVDCKIAKMTPPW